MWRDTLAIWRRHVWRKIIRRFLKKNVSAFWRKHSAIFGENRSEILEIWRTLFGEIVVSDLEKLFGDFGENRSAILEIVMEYRNARRLSTEYARQSTEGYPAMVDLSVGVRVIRNRMVTQDAETTI